MGFAADGEWLLAGGLRYFIFSTLFGDDSYVD